MPKTIVVAALALTLLAAPAAYAKGTAANTTGCTPQPALEHPFAPWGDSGFYVLHPGGDMESGVPGWTLAGGAAIVAGDDALGVRPGARVLWLPAGASVVTAPICVDETYTHARALARSTVAAGSSLDVDVLYTETRGRSVVKGSKRLTVSNGAWAPSATIDIDAKLAGAAPISFRFTAPKSSGWLIDDFYVDPRFRS
jgi:hypothetical protein